MWDLRHTLTGDMTEAIVAHLHQDAYTRKQVHCPQCNGLWTVHAPVPRTVETMVGSVQLERLYVYCRTCCCDLSPLHAVVGLITGRTQLDVQKAAAKPVTEVPYEAAQTLFGDLTGVGLGSARMHPLTKHVAEGLTVLDVASACDESERRIAEVAAESWRRPVVVLGIDGALKKPCNRSITTVPQRHRGQQATQWPKVASHVPDGSRPESCGKRCARCVANDTIIAAVYFFPYAQVLVAQLAWQTLALVIDSSVVGRGGVALMIHMAYKDLCMPLAWLVRRGKKGHCPEALESVPSLPTVPAVVMHMRSLVPMAVPIIAVVIHMRSLVPMAVSVAVPIIVVVMVMSPGPMRIPVRAVIPCTCDDGRRTGNHDWYRGPDAHSHTHSCVGQERQRPGCETYQRHDARHPSEYTSTFHCVTLLVSRADITIFASSLHP